MKKDIYGISMAAPEVSGVAIDAGHVPLPAEDLGRLQIFLQEAECVFSHLVKRCIAERSGNEKALAALDHLIVDSEGPMDASLVERYLMGMAKCLRSGYESNEDFPVFVSFK